MLTLQCNFGSAAVRVKNWHKKVGDIGSLRYLGSKCKGEGGEKRQQVRLNIQLIFECLLQFFKTFSSFIEVHFT